MGRRCVKTFVSFVAFCESVLSVYICVNLRLICFFAFIRSLSRRRPCGGGSIRGPLCVLAALREIPLRG
jgi:hypothetical protein